MECPAAWECVLWQRIKAALEASGRVHSSYYRMAEEAVRLCAIADGQ